MDAIRDDTVPKRIDKFGRATCPVDLDFPLTDESGIRSSKKRGTHSRESKDIDNEDGIREIQEHRPSLSAKFLAPDIGSVMDRYTPFGEGDGEEDESWVDNNMLWEPSYTNDKLLKIMDRLLQMLKKSVEIFFHSLE